MALRGNLKDFSLPDVFQLVTFSRKTGVLRIQREDGAEGSVWFRDGDVFFAQSNWHTEPLGERLVKAQRITPQALKRALEVRSGEPEDGRRLGQILIDEGYITEKVLETFVSEQIQDTIFDLMRWDEGDFDFEAMPEVVDEDIGLSVSIENVVMEGARRLEEWTRIKKKIPSMDVVFKMATAPGEGTFEISLKPIEWQLLLLVDGTRSVAELATETSRTDFEVARIVYGLFSAGLLEFATEEEIERNRAERAEREAKQAEIEAARKASEEAAKREALAREAKLAEEAAARRAAEEAATREAAEAAAQAAAEAAAQEAEKVAAADAERAAADAAAEAVAAGPTEVPEFLGGMTVAPTADDQAVLDEFMGAVLEQPAEPSAPEPEPEPEVPAAAPYVPEEVPPFVALAHDESSDDLVVAMPSVEDLLGLTPIEPAVETAVELDVPGEQITPVESTDVESAGLPAELPEEPSAFVEPDVESPESVVEPAADEFARDLLALGLGELPSDLLSPVGEEPGAHTESTDVSVIEADTAPEAASTDIVDEVIEPMSVAEPLAELQTVAEPMSEAAWPAAEQPEAEPAADDEPLDELAALSASLDLPVDVPTEAATFETGEDEAPDFSALLDSLDVDAEDAPAAEPEVTPEAAGFDVDLLMDEEPASGGGVISTDAFLEDISMDDLGFSGSLTDELSALTGAERRGAPRPQASVNAIPDAGSNQLHRDTRVDRDTLLKIIDGIQKL